MRIVLVLAILVAAALAGGADQAVFLLKKGDAKRAAAAAKKLTDKDPTNIDAWMVFTDACIALGEPADAWGPLEGAIERNPKAARLSLKLGDLFVKMAEREQATTRDGTTITNYYLDAERMYVEALVKDPKLADASYGKAFANYNLNKMDRAREFVAECLGLKKDHGDAHALRGDIFYSESKYAEAQQKYEVAIKLGDASPTTYVRYGHTFLVANDRDKAKAAYIEAVKAHPEDTMAIMSGLVNLAGRKWKDATPYLKEAAEAAPKSSRAWYYLGYCEFINNRFGEALTAFHKANRIKPKDASILYYVGYAKEKQGDARDALNFYRKSLKESPGYLEPTSRFEAIIIGMQNDMDAAEKLYEELLGYSPDNGWVHNNYALILRNWAEARGAAKQDKPPAEVTRRVKRSGEVYEIAARLLPTEPQIQSDCGLLFEYYPCNRDYDKAKTYFTRALDISDYCYRDAWSGVARACRATNDWEMLKDYAEGVLGALKDRGKHAIAPVGGGSPQELKSETPRMIAQAEAALKMAEARVK